MIALGRGRIGIEHRKRLTGIGLDDDIGIERNPSEEGYAHIQCRRLSTALPEYFDVIMAMVAL